jgi:hypothetical protein
MYQKKFNNNEESLDSMMRSDRGKIDVEQNYKTAKKFFPGNKNGI